MLKNTPHIKWATTFAQATFYDILLYIMVNVTNNSNCVIICAFIIPCVLCGRCALGKPAVPDISPGTVLA